MIKNVKQKRIQEVIDKIFGGMSNKNQTTTQRSPGRPLPRPINYDFDDEDLDIAPSTLNQWSCITTDVFSPATTTRKNLIPGMYSLEKNGNGELLMIKNTINVDELLTFPNSLHQTILNEIEEFWQKEEIFEQYGFLHRRGYMFYGPPGSGKSCLIQQIIADLINKNDGIVFLAPHPAILNEGLRTLRQIEPKRKLICLFEDLDGYIERFGEDDVLAVLDGENQINNVLNIASTNYPEKLDKRIVSRPRRFDRVQRIEMPNYDMRLLFLQKKLGIENEKEAEDWAIKTEDFSFAMLAELCISCKCFNRSFEETVERLEEMKNNTHNKSDFDDKRVGFSA